MSESIEIQHELDYLNDVWEHESISRAQAKKRYLALIKCALRVGTFNIPGTFPDGELMPLQDPHMEAVNGIVRFIDEKFGLSREINITPMPWRNRFLLYIVKLSTPSRSMQIVLHNCEDFIGHAISPGPKQVLMQVHNLTATLNSGQSDPEVIELADPNLFNTISEYIRNTFDIKH